MKVFPIDFLTEWFLKYRRSLPWRENATPYRVWVSEVMLQQTQVSVVIPYFERWMQIFPTIEALACAPLESVIKVWEGLGYYSRARNLHEAAQFVLKNFGGNLPAVQSQLATIKGLGPYTQGAILSFAFHQRAAAVDGNVMRVLSRYFALEEPIDQSGTRKKIWDLANSLLPEKEPWLVTEALIELGALVCTKVPVCHRCPLQNNCLAFRHQLQNTLPKKNPKPPATQLSRTVGVIVFQKKILLKKGENGKVMADLYEFPYIEEEIESEKVVKAFEKRLDFQLSYLQMLPKVKHTFTRYRVTLFPHLIEAKKEDSRYQWIERKEIVNLPFSSGHRQILKELQDN